MTKQQIYNGMCQLYLNKTEKKKILSTKGSMTSVTNIKIE